MVRRVSRATHGTLLGGLGAGRGIRRRWGHTAPGVFGDGRTCFLRRQTARQTKLKSGKAMQPRAKSSQPSWVTSERSTTLSPGPATTAGGGGGLAVAQRASSFA